LNKGRFTLKLQTWYRLVFLTLFMTFASSETLPDPTPNLETARQMFRTFLDATPRESRVVCLHDTDADGIAAGVVWQRAMQRIEYSNLVRVVPDRERNAWTPENQRRVREAKPDALFVLDLGNQPHDVVENVPTCFVDHHRPGQTRLDQTLISAYSWKPVPNTSLIIYDLFSDLIDIADLDWIAAVGTFSDLGERAPFSLVETTRKKYTAKWIKEATALVNATRRASVSDPEAGARALLKFSSPKELCLSDDADVQAMKAAREEVKAAMNEAKKAAPIFAGQVALIRMNSRCQIHPLIAQIWRGRLPKYIVIAANEGYMDGRINFSARSGNDTNVLQFLRGIELSEGEGNFGHGHDGASGGSLPPARWNELLGKIGFAPEIGVQD